MQHQHGSLQKGCGFEQLSREQSTEWKPGRENDQVKDGKGENITGIYQRDHRTYVWEKDRKGTDQRDDKEKKMTYHCKRQGFKNWLIF